MTDLFLERRFEPALTESDVLDMAGDAADCLGMHRVDWHGSLLSTDGRRMFCWFSAPDTESARIAMRQSNADMTVFWRGSIHDNPAIPAEELTAANVVVERSFDDGTTLEAVQRLEDEGISCLEARGVRFVRTFFSADRNRMICLYRAPDAESVREAQRQAGVPFTVVWAFRAVGPAMPPATTY